MNRRHASASPLRPQNHESSFEGPCIDYIAKVCAAKAPAETNTQLCVIGLGMNLEGVAAALLRRTAVAEDGVGRIYCVVVPDGTPSGTIARIADALRWYVHDPHTRIDVQLSHSGAGDSNGRRNNYSAMTCGRLQRPAPATASRSTKSAVRAREASSHRLKDDQRTKSGSHRRRRGHASSAKQAHGTTNECSNSNNRNSKNHSDSDNSEDDVKDVMLDTHTRHTYGLPVHTIDEGTSTKTRCAAFMQGGVVVSSSRTLCADMLHRRLCVDLVGMVILLFPYSTLGLSPRDTLTPSLAFCTEMLLRDAAARAARQRREAVARAATASSRSSSPNRHEDAHTTHTPHVPTTTYPWSSSTVPSLHVVILSDHPSLMQYLVQRHQTGNERFTHQMHMGDIQLFPRFRLELVTHFEHAQGTDKSSHAKQSGHGSKHQGQRPWLTMERTMHRVSTSTQALDRLLREIVLEVREELQRLDERLQRAADARLGWGTSSTMLGALSGREAEKGGGRDAAHHRLVAAMDEEASHLAPRSASANAAYMDRLGGGPRSLPHPPHPHSAAGGGGDGANSKRPASVAGGHNTTHTNSNSNHNRALRYVYRPWRDRTNPRHLKFAALEEEVCTDVDFGDLDADLHTALRANEPDWAFRALVESMLDVRHLRRALRTGSCFDFLFALQSALQQSRLAAPHVSAGAGASSHACDAHARPPPPPAALWTLSAHFADVVTVATQRIGRLTTVPVPIAALPALPLSESSSSSDSVIDCDALSSESESEDKRKSETVSNAPELCSSLQDRTARNEEGDDVTHDGDTEEKEEKDVIVVEDREAGSSKSSSTHTHPVAVSLNDALHRRPHDSTTTGPMQPGTHTGQAGMQTILVPNSDELGEEDKLELVRRLAHGWCRDAEHRATSHSRGSAAAHAPSRRCDEPHRVSDSDEDESSVEYHSEEEDVCDDVTMHADECAPHTHGHKAQSTSAFRTATAATVTPVMVPAMLIITSGWRELRRCVERLIYTRRTYERLQFDNFLRRYRERCGIRAEPDGADVGNSKVMSPRSTRTTTLASPAWTAGSKRTRFQTRGQTGDCTATTRVDAAALKSECGGSGATGMDNEHKSISNALSNSNNNNNGNNNNNISNRSTTHASDIMTDNSACRAYLPYSAENIATQLPVWLRGGRRRRGTDAADVDESEGGGVKREDDEVREEDDSTGDANANDSDEGGPESDSSSSSSSSHAPHRERQHRRKGLAGGSRGGACRTQHARARRRRGAYKDSHSVHAHDENAAPVGEPDVLFSQPFAGTWTATASAMMRHSSHGAPPARSLHEILLTQPYLSAEPAEASGHAAAAATAPITAATVTDVSDDEQEVMDDDDCRGANERTRKNASSLPSKDGVDAGSAFGSARETTSTFQVEQLRDNMAVLILGADETSTNPLSTATGSPAHQRARVIVMDGSFLCVADVVQMITGTHPALQCTAMYGVDADTAYAAPSCASGEHVTQRPHGVSMTDGLPAAPCAVSAAATNSVASTCAGEDGCAWRHVPLSARVRRVVLTQQSLPHLRMLEMAQDDLLAHATAVFPRIKVHVMSSVFSDARFHRTVAHEREAFQSLAHTKATLTGTLLVDRAALRRTEEELQSSLLRHNRGRVGRASGAMHPHAEEDATNNDHRSGEDARRVRAELAPMPMRLPPHGGTGKSGSYAGRTHSGSLAGAQPVHPDTLRHIPPLIVFDEREFRSTLPYELYCRRVDLVPLTLTTADYVLSPDYAVERKSVPDYHQSLQSGRIFHQLAALSHRYAQPLCLLEFSRGAPFRLTYTTTLWGRVEGGGASMSVTGRVYGRTARLMAAHPRVCFLWARSPAHSAMMMLSFKRGAAAVNVDPGEASLTSYGLDGDVDVGVGGERAGHVGRRTGGNVSAGGVSELSHYAARVLSRFPGVTPSNASAVMQVCGSLAGLATVAKSALQGVMEEQAADQLYAFLHSPFAESVE